MSSGVATGAINPVDGAEDTRQSVMKAAGDVMDGAMDTVEVRTDTDCVRSNEKELPL